MYNKNKMPGINKKLIFIIGGVILFVGAILAVMAVILSPSEQDPPLTIINSTLQASYAFEDSFDNIIGPSDVYAFGDDSLVKKAEADYQALKRLVDSLQSINSIGVVDDEVWAQTKLGLEQLLDQYDSNIKVASHFVSNFFVPLNKLLTTGDTSVSAPSSRESLSSITSDSSLLELDGELSKIFSNLQTTIRPLIKNGCISFDEEIVINENCDNYDEVDEQIVLIEEQISEYLAIFSEKLSLTDMPRARDALLPISEGLGSKEIVE